MPRKKASSANRNLGILLLVFAILLALVNLEDGGFFRKRGIQAKTPGRVHKLSQEEKLRLATDQTLNHFGISLKWITHRGNDREVRVPSQIPPVVIYQALHERVRELGGQVVRGTEDLKTGINTLSYSFSGKTLGTIRLIPEPRLQRRTGRIAIIIDDFGYNRGEGFFDLPFPITYSIIPGLSHSQSIAARLQASGKPMMIHLPMEPLEARVEDDGFTLFTRLSAEEVRSRVRRAIQYLPQARGLNNHMGSLATINDPLLRTALDEMRRADFFFVDSRTNPNTHAYTLARQMGLDAGISDIFLDAEDDSHWIAGKLMRLADLAAQRGHAIGIGHPNDNTLRVLRELVPTLQQRGFEFVPVEEVLRPRALAMQKLTQRE